MVLDNHKRARSSELMPLQIPHKDGTAGNIYKEKRPARPLSPNQQVNIMLALEKEEFDVIGDPSHIDMEVTDYYVYGLPALHSINIVVNELIYFI